MSLPIGVLVTRLFTILFGEIAVRHYDGMTNSFDA